MKSIPQLLLEIQQESQKNPCEFNISVTLDDAVKKLYTDAETRVNKKLRHQRSPDELDKRHALVGELMIALTQILAKSDLMEQSQYDTLSQSVQRWCPWEVENLKSSQLVRQLLIYLLPQVRKKQQLQQICGEYKDHLTTEIEGELRSDHPKAYAHYEKAPSRVFGGPKISPDTVVAVRIDSARPMDQFVAEQAPGLEKPSERLTILLSNYQAVRRMEDSLNKPIKPVTTQLQDFSKEFKAQRNVIEKNPDNAAVKFIKSVINFLSKGLVQRLGFWKIPGQEVSQQIEKTLTSSSMLAATPMLKGG